MKKIVVTGANGFIGSWICQIGEIDKSLQYDILNGDDIRFKDVQLDIAHNSECVIHLAAESGIEACQKNPGLALELNTKATIELAEQCKKSGCRRFIFASSSAVYGEAGNYFIDENHPASPRTVYGQSKLGAEKILGLADSNFEVIILRKSNVYGYGMFYKGITVIDRLIEKFIDRQPFEIAGDGAQKRDFVHVQDVANLYLKITRASKVRSGIYNVGGTETVSIRKLAGFVNDIGSSIFGYRVSTNYGKGESGVSWHDFKYDWKKARMEFQYQPKFRIEDYLKERFLLEMRSF